MTEESIERFTLLVLFQAQQDHATELAIAPTISGRPPIRYKVEGTWYDMSPPETITIQRGVSMDGFIAGPEGEYDWIIMDPSFEYERFFKEFDTLLMGRRTYEFT